MEQKQNWLKMKLNYQMKCETNRKWNKRQKNVETEEIQIDEMIEK